MNLGPQDRHSGKEPSTGLGRGPHCLLEAAGTSDRSDHPGRLGECLRLGWRLRPAGAIPSAPRPLPRATLPSPLLPSPLLLLGVEIAFQLPFAFPINPDSAIKPAGGAGREAAAERVLWGLSPRRRSHPPQIASCSAVRGRGGSGTPGAPSPSSERGAPRTGAGGGRALLAQLLRGSCPPTGTGAGGWAPRRLHWLLRSRRSSHAPPGSG